MSSAKIVALVIFSVCLASALPVCEDKNALYAVNATVLANKWSKRIHVSTNFYLLDNYSSIDVYQANVTDLCEGMIKNFPKLEALSLININLSRLQTNVFKNVPRLQKISLAVNHLKKIIRGSFDNLPSLEVLYLSSNEISYIEEKAFASMPHLKEVHLDRNHLTDVNGNLFIDSVSVAVVDFRFNNIKKITRTSFEDLTTTSSRLLTILLNKNQIDNVEEEAFEHLPPVNLHLEGNRMSQLSPLFHKIQDGSKLYLNGNLLSCIPEDVLDNIRVSYKYLYVKDNPLDCTCVRNMKRTLQDDYSAQARFIYKSSLPCDFVNRFVF